MKNKFIIICICLVFVGCEDLGLNYIEPILITDISLKKSTNHIFKLKFDKKDKYYMTCFINLTKGAGTNPIGGQKIEGSYKINNNIQNFKHILTPNQLGGKLFVIDSTRLDVSKTYLLEVNFKVSVNFFKYYDPKISLYLQRKPAYPIVD